MTFDDIYAAFIGFVKNFGYTDDNIWRANQNAGPINPPCCIVSVGNATPDSTNFISDIYDHETPKLSHTAGRIASIEVSLDFYGSDALDNASAAGVAFEDSEFFDLFIANGIVPVESTEPMHLPFIGQDAMDYDRYKITCTVNYNPKITITTDFATEIRPELIRVQNLA